MRAGGILGIVAILAAVLVGAPSPSSAATSAAASSAPTPVVDGTRLVDSRTGARWDAHAVNWPSFEYACQQGWAYASGGRDAAAAAAMVSWGITAVRLPLNEACWLGVDGAPAYGTSAGYRSAVNDWVGVLNAAGLVVILDLHWTSPAGYPANGQRAMTDARSVTFWSQVATAYASNRSVMFDVFNEPYSRWNNTTNSWTFQLTWSCWRDGGCRAPVENDQTSTLSGATYVVAGMTQLVAAVRGAGATQPVLLGGLDYSNDLRQWLEYRPADSQLVASWHNYPGQRCSSSSCWNAEIAPVAAVVPVIASEFGQTDGGSSFLTTFMTWADAHGVGYAPWAWWIVPASEGLAAHRYALIADSSFTPQAPSGTAFHDHLATLSPSSSGHPVPPFGVVDSVSLVGSTLTAWGWAIDPDTAAGIQVRLMVDGAVV
ncbi:MAG: cellulase family glycosylhydrolase, partial [Pseudolysinimonas sp.]|uniref:glycoside hydrolase family 5 protein n=1 Tax=Pseudolysinimonas sp. TaxID=2680009 RepID=UPI003266E73F